LGSETEEIYLKKIDSIREKEAERERFLKKIIEESRSFTTTAEEEESTDKLGEEDWLEICGRSQESLDLVFLGLLRS
jgi:hypothetical protein